MPAIDEDIVTMAATAARPIIDRHGADRIRTVLVATESGVDQAKAAGLYLHPLIGLPATARVVELKQACYSGAAGLQFAAALCAREPDQAVLVIATDIARYDLDTPAEPTQGAAAAAILVTADPAIAELEPVSGIFSADVTDFWRPNYRSTAVVDGKLSITAYLAAAASAFTDYRRRGGRGFDDFAAVCYHQPFTQMAYKAHRHLLEGRGRAPATAALDSVLAATTHYNRVIGNSYTASLYLALASLLDHTPDLTDRPIALLSYGSGAVAEFFSATPAPGYHQHLRTQAHHDALAQRKPLTYDHYRTLHRTQTPTDGAHHTLPEDTNAPFRLAAITSHKRIYKTRQPNELRSRLSHFSQTRGVRPGCDGSGGGFGGSACGGMR